MTQLDHIMYACPDLQTGINDIFALTGVMPTMGGSHPGAGTRNALLSLNNEQYLEIIAPDPAQDLTRTTGQVLLDHGGSGIRSWAIACDDLGKVAAAAALQQLATRDVISMSRRTPEGVELAWQLLFLEQTHLPFFIDWQQSPHPALSTPTGCELTAFSVSADQPEQYQAFLSQLGVLIPVTAGPNAFTAELSTPNGAVLLRTW